MYNTMEENITKRKPIQAEARILAVMRTMHPKAGTAKQIQKSCCIYWKKHIATLSRLVEEGKIEKIETSTYPFYRLIKNEK